MRVARALSTANKNVVNRKGERMSKHLDRQIGMLPDYDQNIYRGVLSKTDELKENSLIKKSLSKALGAQIDVTLETGEVAVVTIADVLVAHTLKDAITKPNTSKLKDIAAITGELRDNVDLNIQTPQDLFGDIIVNNRTDK